MRIEASAAMAATARFRSRSTELVPLTPEHVQRLRSLELAPDIAFRWRYGGVHPSPEEHHLSTWSDVLCAFLVFSVEDPSSPRGLVSAYHADHRNGHCRIAATRLGAERSQNLTLSRGLLLFFDYLFQGWPFRKLYLEVPEYNLGQFGSAEGKLFEREATLASYSYLDGRYWDLIFLSMSRERWLQERERLSSFIGLDRE